jgi:pimeloyl-ACP methyl ester carboxylesterase
LRFFVVRKIEARHESEIRQYAINQGVTDTKHIQKLVEVFGSVWLFTDIRIDPKSLIADYDGPVLALFGSKDLLVSAAINESATRNLFRHSQSEAYTFPGLNHLFQTAKKGIGPDEYWEIETTIEEEVIEKIDIWMKSLSVNQKKRNFI